MRNPIAARVATAVCLITVLGCTVPGPTSPANPEPGEAQSVSLEAKGGAARTFDVTLTGSLTANVAGAVDPSVKANDTQLNLFDFPMDVTFLQTAVANGGTCFADAQIGVDENIELRIGTPKKGSSTVEVTGQYWFDGVSTKGEYTLYRLTLQGNFVSGQQTWIGDAVIDFTTFGINGQVEGTKGGKPAKSACNGSGNLQTTVTLQEVG